MPIPRNIEWVGDAATGHLRLLDQTLLPTAETYRDCTSVQDVWDAIKCLAVRGAPAIGIAAAFGCVIGAQNNAFDEACEYLAASRPTAVNLFWAIERMKRVVPREPAALLGVALRIHDEDAGMCDAIGGHGVKLIDSLEATCRGVMTHCNAGALATGGIGTATAPMYRAHELGMPFQVYIDETRPLLQGARLTAYELHAAGLDATLICDNMAGQVMREGRVGLVITGADRVAANGDSANKIGTYSLAVLAKHHGIPFYIAAPSSTFDLSLANGDAIPIEQRDSDEISSGMGKRTAPEGMATYNPAFDVTPATLIAGIVTERGIISPVDTQTVGEMVG